MSNKPKNYRTKTLVQGRLARFASMYSGQATKVVFKGNLVCTDQQGTIYLPSEFHLVTPELEEKALAMITHEVGHDFVNLELQKLVDEGGVTGASSALFDTVKEKVPSLEKVLVNPSHKAKLDGYKLFTKRPEKVAELWAKSRLEGYGPTQFKADKKVLTYQLAHHMRWLGEFISIALLQITGLEVVVRREYYEKPLTDLALCYGGPVVGSAPTSVTSRKDMIGWCFNHLQADKLVAYVFEALEGRKPVKWADGFRKTINSASTNVSEVRSKFHKLGWNSDLPSLGYDPNLVRSLMTRDPETVRALLTKESGKYVDEGELVKFCLDLWKKVLDVVLDEVCFSLVHQFVDHRMKELGKLLGSKIRNLLNAVEDPRQEEQSRARLQGVGRWLRKSNDDAFVSWAQRMSESENVVTSESLTGIACLYYLERGEMGQYLKDDVRELLDLLKSESFPSPRSEGMYDSFNVACYIFESQFSLSTEELIDLLLCDDLPDPEAENEGEGEGGKATGEDTKRGKEGNKSEGEPRESAKGDDDKGEGDEGEKDEGEGDEGQGDEGEKDEGEGDEGEGDKKTEGESLGDKDSEGTPRAPSLVGTFVELEGGAIGRVVKDNGETVEVEVVCG